MSSRYLYLVRMDVAHDLEPTFNEVYDTEHAPLLAAVPGVRPRLALPEPVADISPLHRRLRAREPGGAAERRVEDGRRGRAAGRRKSARTP